MTLPELGAVLVAGGLGLTVGTNLFYGPVQDRPDAVPVVGLLPYFGARPSEGAFGTSSLTYEWPRVQVTVRGAVDGLEAALTLAEGVYKALGAVQAQTVSTTFYHQVTCLQPPYLLRYDANRRPLVVFNVQAEKRVSA